MPAEKNQLSLSDIFMIPPKKKLPEEEVEEDDDDTLSFCDLPAYCTAAEWAKYSGESQGSSGSSFTSLSSSSSLFSGEGEEGGNSFEFFREEWKNAAVSNAPENIIFCGKLIPSKKQQQPSPEKKIGGGLLLRIFRTKIGSSKKGESDETTSSSAKYDDGRRLSVMTSSLSGKSRWLSVFFGFSRVPAEAMGMRSIKNRRSLKTTSSSSSSTRTENGDGENAILSGGDGARRRLWRVIRALSCGGSHHSLIRSVGVDGLFAESVTAAGKGRKF